jgi:hypothetical protein
MIRLKNHKEKLNLLQKLYWKTKMSKKKSKTNEFLILNSKK